jgi:deoxyribose-phosphate aldolase
MNLASYIDHTLLKADTTRPDIEQLCQEAKEFSFYSVCLNSRWIPLAKTLLKESSVKIVTVVGFPLGASLSPIKALEAVSAIKAGALEVDMVLDIGAARSDLWDDVESDIKEVVMACQGLPLKVILETCYLNSEQIVEACKRSERAGAQFVKTSTGFGSQGASVEVVRLMKKTVGERMQVKASGGIRTQEQALQMIAAGATRLGTSNSIAIVQGSTSHEKGRY